METKFYEHLESKEQQAEAIYNEVVFADKEPTIERMQELLEYTKKDGEIRDSIYQYAKTTLDKWLKEKENIIFERNEDENISYVLDEAMGEKDYNPLFLRTVQQTQDAATWIVNWAENRNIGVICIKMNPYSTDDYTPRILGEYNAIVSENGNQPIRNTILLLDQLDYCKSQKELCSLIKTHTINGEKIDFLFTVATAKPLVKLNEEGNELIPELKRLFTIISANETKESQRQYINEYIQKHIDNAADFARFARAIAWRCRSFTKQQSYKYFEEKVKETWTQIKQIMNAVLSETSEFDPAGIEDEMLNTSETFLRIGKEPKVPSVSLRQWKRALDNCEGTVKDFLKKVEQCISYNPTLQQQLIKALKDANIISNN